jgi:hypothetical protein
MWVRKPRELQLSYYIRRATRTSFGYWELNHGSYTTIP